MTPSIPFPGLDVLTIKYMLRTVMRCERIVVLDADFIFGCHAAFALMSKKPAFRRIDYTREAA